MRCGICDEPLDGTFVLLDGEECHLACAAGEQSSGPDTLLSGVPTPPEPPAPEPTTRRGRLDRDMQRVLTELARCSHVPASGYEPRSRASDETPGGARPPGDIGHTKYAREYGPPFHERSPRHPGAIDDDARERVLRRAAGELQHIRGHDIRPRPTGESRQERDDRIVKEGEGWTVREVAIHFRCGEREVRKAREAKEREPDYGRRPKRDADAEARRERALELDAKGLTLAQIARLLDVHRSTIERDLGKRAA